MELEIIKSMIEDTQNEIHTSLPAIIKSIDYSAGTCTVEIIPQRVLCGKLTKYPTLIDYKNILQYKRWFQNQCSHKIFLCIYAQSCKKHIENSRTVISSKFIYSEKLYHDGLLFSITFFLL